jgi:hypothetical protein
MISNAQALANIVAPSPSAAPIDHVSDPVVIPAASARPNRHPDAI